MAEPDNIVLEHLRAIRLEVGEMKQRVLEIDRKLDGKAEIAHVAAVERKLDGLTHDFTSFANSPAHR
jgi:hypothetical protein